MTVMKTVSVGLVATLAAVAAGQAVEAPGAIEQELMRLENGAMERWRQGDPMGWAEIAAPEVTYVDPSLTKPIVGLGEYSRYLEKLKGQILYDASDFMRPRVAVYGDLAVLTFNYQARTHKPDGTVQRHAPWNTTEVYVRTGGAWRIVHTHWSYLEHALPEQAELPLPVELKPKVDEGVLGELLALERAAMLRWRRGDPTGFIEIFAPEVTYFDTGTPQRIDGFEALAEECRKRTGKIHYDVMEFVQPSVQVYGDAAVLFYRFLSTNLRSDGSIQSRTPWNCTEVYVKRDGVWQIVHSHWSFIGGRPAKGGPADF
jgi:ketosteroid isomerase-like protein